MIDPAIIEMLTGPTGGVFALGGCFGGVVGWNISQRAVVSIYKANVELMKSRIDALEAEVKELQESKLEMAMSK